MLINPAFEKILNRLSEKKRMVDSLYGYHLVDRKYQVLPDEKIHQEIVKNGFYLDAGFNYFIFVFKNKFYKKYDNVVMLYSEFDLKSPLQIVFSNYPRTPLFYLLQVLYTAFTIYTDKQESVIKRSGSLTKEIRTLFVAVEKLIESHETKEERNRKVFNRFEKSITPGDTIINEIPIVGDLDKKDKLLEIKLEDAFTGSKTNVEPIETAELGFVLKKDSNVWLIEPVMIPSKRMQFGSNNTNELQKQLKPLKITPLQLSRYRLLGCNSTMENMVLHYLEFETNSAQNRDHLRFLNNAYFKMLTDTLKNTPPELLFCRPENGTELPLKINMLKKISISFHPVLADDEQNFNICLDLAFEGKERSLSSCDYHIIANGKQYYLVICDQKSAHLVYTDHIEDAALNNILKFLAEEDHNYHIENFEQILTFLQSFHSDNIAIASSLEKKYQVDIYPDVIFSVDLEKGGSLTVDFDYDGKIDTFYEKHADMKAVEFVRISDYESLLLYHLEKDSSLEMLPESKDNTFRFFDLSPHEWLVRNGNTYLKKGIRIYLPKFGRELNYNKAKLNIKAGSGIDWFEYEAELENNDGSALSVKEIFQDTSIVVDTEENIHLLTENELKKLKILLAYCDKDETSGRYKMQAANDILFEKINEMLESDIPGNLSAVPTINATMQGLKNIKDYNISPNFKGTLRRYQQHGYNWLNFMLQHKLNCCLADDMGLGKTVQTLALLQSLKDEKKLKISLLVLPLVSIHNWEDEIKKFTAGLNYLRYTGPKRKDNLKLLKGKNIDLVITSYNILRLDIETLKEQTFDLLILDESQNIKNPDSKISKSAKIINARHKICLTGTPMENNLTDLWSLFDFLRPGYLGSKKWFTNKFAFPVEKKGDQEKAETLKKMIFPFILRRTKENVEADLPEKTEIIRRVELAPEQRRIYGEISQKYKMMMKNEIKGKGVNNSRMLLFELLLKLRQFCLFPSMAGKEFTGVPSAKLESIDLLMDDILAENHRILIFSQFREVHDNLKKHLAAKEIKYYHFDGRTDMDRRKGMIDKFQQGTDDVNVFLLSLKAGGVSINLTGADYVFIFDPWWNPAVEAQAIDRAHRIGQTKKVVAYKVITAGTIEEKIHELQRKKKDLYDSLISEDISNFKQFSEDDIMDLFE